MLPTPKKYFLTAASAEGRSKLTAFDNALLKARVGNVNLIRVSSILPPEAELEEGLEIPPGSLVPIAYGSIISDVPGETISAAVAVGLSHEGFGVIMEFSGKCPKDEAVEIISDMVREAFETRQRPLVEIKVAAVEHKVEKLGCAFAAVPLWY